MSKRLFVSVGLDGMADAIGEIQEPFADADGVRTTDPTQTHVTLQFLGETDADRTDAVVDAIEAAVVESGVSPFEAEFGGLGVFPSLEYISVIWVGIRDGGQELTALHRAIEKETTAMGFEADEHEFTPHATIARMDQAGDKERVQRQVNESDPDVGTLPVDEVRLTESVLGPDGPTYETVAAVTLPQ